MVFCKVQCILQTMMVMKIFFFSFIKNGLKLSIEDTVFCKVQCILQTMMVIKMFFFFHLSKKVLKISIENMVFCKVQCILQMMMVIKMGFFFSVMVNLPTLDDDKNVRLMNNQKIALV